MEKNPIATILMENGKNIIIELLPDNAPNTVNSFIYLAKKRVFDNHRIERVEPGFVVDASATAFGKSEAKYLIANEALALGKDNPIKPELGVICMGGYGGNIAAGEFYFPLAYHERLHGNYPCFGRVLEGLDEITRIGRLPVRPFEKLWPGAKQMHTTESDEIIKSVTVETFGVEYEEPEKLTDVKLPVHW